jgi:hypothetical protein
MDIYSDKIIESKRKRGINNSDTSSMERGKIVILSIDDDNYYGIGNLKKSEIEERERLLGKARRFRIRGNETVILSVMFLKSLEMVMVYSTVFSCINIWVDWSAAGF